MTCQELDARLDDWLDGALAPDEAALVEAHLAGCAACRDEERKLRQLLARATTLPRQLTPPRDLWPGIERQIGRQRGLRMLFGWTPSLALATAAVVVIGVFAVLWNSGQGAVQSVEIPAATPDPRVVEVSTGEPVADPLLAQAERDYEKAANALLEALQQRRGAMAPEDFDRLQANLQVIDRALAEVRQALVKDPANAELSRMLVSTHRKKVDVLRRVVRLSTEL
jgi:anti-sigma factor RsiW